MTTPLEGTLKSVGITTAPLTLYVEKWGSDTNPGTATQPKLTIQGAINAIPKIVRHNVTIRVGPGTYTDLVYTTTGANISTYETEQTPACAVFKGIVTGEGVTISLIGDTANPANVVIDGQDTANVIGIFVFNVLRVNLRGITVQNCAYNVQYKRRASGQLRNMRLTNGTYGLFSYQYCFVEVQGDTVIDGASSIGLYCLGHHYGAMSGLTVQNCGRGVLAAEGSFLMLYGVDDAVTIQDNTTDNISVDRAAHITAIKVIVSGTPTEGQIRVWGSLFIYNADTTITGAIDDAAIEVFAGGYAEVNGITISSGADPTTVSGMGVRAREGGRIKLNNVTISGFYHNVVLTYNSVGYVESCVVNNARFDGLYVDGGHVTLKNVTHTTINARAGLTVDGGGSFRDLGGNTVSGTSSGQFRGLSVRWPQEYGTTAARPTTFLGTGRPYFDTTLGKPIWYYSGWKDATGTEV